MKTIVNLTMKKCYNCNKYKNESSFYKNKSRKDGLCDECKDCHIFLQKKYYKKNKKKILLYKKHYYNKNKSKILKREEIYRKKNRKKILNSERRARQNHPETHRKKNRKYCLKKKQLVEQFTVKEWMKKVQKTNGVCPVCGRFYSEVFPFCATLDHTPPISKAPVGFCYTIDNINPMCGSCNNSKGNSF